MNLIGTSSFLMIILLWFFSSSAEAAKFCNFDNDCSVHLKCTAGKCKNPCINKCLADERCLVDRWHEAHCTYITKTCQNNNDCNDHLKCDGKTKTCVDPCNNYCNSREYCTVENHRPNCFRYSNNNY